MSGEENCGNCSHYDSDEDRGNKHHACSAGYFNYEDRGGGVIGQEPIHGSPTNPDDVPCRGNAFYPKGGEPRREEGIRVVNEPDSTSLESLSGQNEEGFPGCRGGREGIE